MSDADEKTEIESFLSPVRTLSERNQIRGDAQFISAYADNRRSSIDAIYDEGERY